MQAVLSAWHEQATCTWCEWDKEAVTVDFGDGFIRRTPLCWKCLQKAVRVRQRQETLPPKPVPAHGAAAAPANRPAT